MRVLSTTCLARASGWPLVDPGLEQAPTDPPTASLLQQDEAVYSPRLAISKLLDGKIPEPLLLAYSKCTELLRTAAWQEEKTEIFILERRERQEGREPGRVGGWGKI